MDKRVSIVPCESYTREEAHKALTAVLAPLGGLDFVTPGMRVIIKVNLVAAKSPDTATTTHPVLVAELTKMLVARGAEVIVGDSPGGLYDTAVLNRNYTVTGMRAVEVAGGRLNQNFGQKQASYPEGKILKQFLYTSYLDRADVIINFCKLKSHGMMTLSGAAKNMFGAIPGIVKPEYHYRFPDYHDFADMLLDIDEYFAPRLSIMDAVVAMEGNGPTAGVPRHVGALLAAENPHAADLLAADLIGLKPESVPTLAAAQARGLIPEAVSELEIHGDAAPFHMKDFEIVTESGGLKFEGSGKNALLNFGVKIAERLLQSEPRLKTDSCVGCNVCGGICPAHAIIMKDKKAQIDRHACIRCFCCQEFCPKGAMKVHRTLTARLVAKL